MLLRERIARRICAPHSGGSGSKVCEMAWTMADAAIEALREAPADELAEALAAGREPAVVAS